jgi:hypothetical protein
MSQHSKQAVRIPRLVVIIFRPVRWFRRQWRYAWFKLLATGVVSAVLLAASISWSDFTARRSWEDWLANLRPSGARSSNSSVKFGVHRKRQPGDKEPLLSYLGGGRAEFGDFSVCVFDPITQSSLRTDFRLRGTTSLGDEASFQQFMRCNQRFFREQVGVVLRMHNVDDLTSPDLDLLGRKIVARVNRSLGKRVLKSAEIKDFAVYESIDRSSFVPWESGEEDGMP